MAFEKLLWLSKESAANCSAFQNESPMRFLFLFLLKGPASGSLFHCFLVCLFGTVYEAEFNSQMNPAAPTVNQDVQRVRERGTRRKRRVQLFSLNHHPGSYQQAGGSNGSYSWQSCHFPANARYRVELPPTHRKRSAFATQESKSYRAWRRRHRHDGCSHGEDQGPLIEQTLAIFCRPEMTVLLVWDTAWNKDISGERGQAEVLKEKCLWVAGGKAG